MKNLKYYIPVYGAVQYAHDAYEKDYQNFLQSGETYFKSSMDSMHEGDYFMMCLMMQIGIYIQVPLMVWAYFQG